MREPLPLPDLIPNFPWDEYKEGQGFTLLHEIVCRISGRDLDSAVQTHSADINKLDYEGRSPLEMAIRHENLAAIRTLLRRGADPNICNGMPICTALVWANSETIELLLRFGATVHGSAGDNIAAKWIDSGFCRLDPGVLAIDRLLVEHGIDVNYQHRGRTLLMELCQGGRYQSNAIQRIEQLVNLGANLELKDYKGWTAIHYAVSSDRIDALKIFVHAGARLDVKTYKGDTIAHLAVISSTSSEVAKAISEIDLVCLDLDTKNEDGYTAYDLLRKRNGLRWENYCEKLLESEDGYLLFPRCLSPEHEYQVILALEALLHHIQDSQGVPTDQQYPPLGEYLSDDKDEEPVPGAWPV